MNPSILPPGWSSTRLIDTAEKIMDFRGRTPKKLGMDWGGGSIPAISARNVRMGSIDFTQEFYVGSDALYRRWMTHGDMEKGDVLITTEAPLGNVAAVPDHRRYILSQRTVLLRPRSSSFDKTFVLKFFQSPGFQRLLTENATGSTALGIQRKRLEQLPVVAPSLAEQRRIGEALQDIDDFIAALDRSITKKQAIKQGMQQQLLRQVPPSAVREVSVASVIRKSFSGPSPTCDERDVRGEEWGVLKTTCSTWDRGWDPCAHKVLPREYWGTSRLEVRPGDTMITKAGPRHRVGVPAYVSDVPPRIVPSGKMICLRPETAEVAPQFLAIALADRRTQAHLDQRTTGMAESQVNFENGDLLAAPLYLPDVAVQQRIVDPLSDSDREISLLHLRLEKARAIKSGMMQELLTGHTRLPRAEAVA